MELVTLSQQLTDRQFNAIATLVKDLCGINLHDGKKPLAQARLVKRLRALKMDSFEQYIDYISGPDGSAEILSMLDVLTTNLTYFFREMQHFDYLRQAAIPAMLARHRDDRRLRIWSAGCSSGDEPYSIAITLRQSIPNLDLYDTGILATDLSRRMLTAASAGVYSLERIRRGGHVDLDRYFHPVSLHPPRTYRVKDELRHLVHFSRLNLMESWPMKGRFDVIFCRNVMIYFDKPTQARLVERFYDQLLPGGILLIGHSESLTGIRHRFGYVSPTIYVRS